MKRVFMYVLDSFGIGELPDAAEFGDVGTNTLRSCMTSQYFQMPNMGKLGLFHIDGVESEFKNDEPIGAYARLAEVSKGKDTTTGHWELAGIISKEAMPTYPNGFPEDILEEFRRQTGRGILCNQPYSGTEVIQDFGKEHVDTGKFIVYTSADSVFQVAAHEEIVPLEELYEACRIARKILTGKHAVGRVIARPFTGDEGHYERTRNRHDFSLLPTAVTMLDQLSSAGFASIGVGKIKDIFAGQGITEYVYTQSNEDGIEKAIDYMKKEFEGLCFINLVDYDMLYGHRNDIDGYAKALHYFDSKLPEIMEAMREEDILMITADHGCDPGFVESTDHSREYVPLLIYGKSIKPGNYGTRNTFADAGCTVLDYFGITPEIQGTSLLK